MDSEAVYSNRTFPLRRRKIIRKRAEKLGSFRQPRKTLSHMRGCHTEGSIKTDRVLAKLARGVKKCVDSLYAQQEQTRVAEGLLTQIRGFSCKPQLTSQTPFTSLQNLLPVQDSLTQEGSQNTMEFMRSEVLSNSLLVKADAPFLLAFYHHLQKLLNKRKLNLRRDPFKSLVRATWRLCEKYIYDSSMPQHSLDYEAEWTIFEALDFSLGACRKDLWELQLQLSDAQYNC